MIPAVSTKQTGIPSISIHDSRMSLVVPGTFVTIAFVEPEIVLKSVDFPAFGFPHKTTLMPPLTILPNLALLNNFFISL